MTSCVYAYLSNCVTRCIWVDEAVKRCIRVCHVVVRVCPVIVIECEGPADVAIALPRGLTQTTELTAKVASLTESLIRKENTISQLEGTTAELEAQLKSVMNDRVATERQVRHNMQNV